MNILVTGSCGMIGSALKNKLLEAGFCVVGVDKADADSTEGYRHYKTELENTYAVDAVFEKESVDRVIHLAALAHAFSGGRISYDDYYRANVICSENIFKAAEKRKIPVLFISTVDVYGFTNGAVNSDTPLYPVTDYGKTKAEAEQKLRELVSSYTIFRFSPVYTDTVKRDIEKRYYLKAPKLAYIIGKGKNYEVLNIELAVESMAEWTGSSPANEIRIIKDPLPLNTADAIKKERANGRARRIIRVPDWAVSFGFSAIYALTGKNKYTFLLNKAANPLETE